jgi:hypothetical protein
MRAKTAKLRAKRRTVLGKPKRVRKPQLLRVEYSKEVIEEAPPKTPISIFTEETEITEHQEELVLAKTA